MAKKQKRSEAWHNKQFARAEKVLEKNFRKLLRRKGVTGVDVNYRIQNGKLTDEIVICVHVEEKVSLDELRANQVIEEIDGIPVDIVESMMNDYEQSATTVRAGRGIAPVIDGRVRGQGTFGATVFDQDTAEPFGLTNAHVVRGGLPKTSPRLGSTVPIVTDRKKSNVVGKAIIARSFLTAKVDCALVRPLDGITFAEGISHGEKVLMHPPGCYGQLTRKNLRDRVKIVKLGAKTSVTTGQLAAIKQSFSVPGHTFMSQIIIRRIGSASFSEGGDSGSVLMHNGCIVGLLHGLTNDKKFAVACHIAEVRRLLNI